MKITASRVTAGKREDILKRKAEYEASGVRGGSRRARTQIQHG